MDDLGEHFNAMREESKARRANNRAGTAAILRKLAVDFTEHNGGAHIVVKRGRFTADLWPGTGKWIMRDGFGRGRGVGVLLSLLGLTRQEINDAKKGVDTRKDCA